MKAAYRNEIVKLRAIAVLCVVLFHLRVPGFERGFVGVDVFFVISGYLITRNILNGLCERSFSLGQFYVRRTRRIYPALIFTVVATYLAGALWCSPLMFLDLAKECTHALLSISNIQYWRESYQYFAPNSEELALLHCWSLSLEEQFYLIWPLFIVFAAKMKRLRSTILIVTILSFSASLAVARSDPAATFYLMPFRIYEFGCGALVLFAEGFDLGRVSREVASVAGFLLIVLSAIALPSDLENSEVLSVLPCLGAAAIILAGDKTQISKSLSNPAVTGIGTISYSLYLCHWPIIFFGRFIFGESADTWVGTLIMFLSMLVVATAMYRSVERRFIQSPGLRLPGMWRNAAAFGLVVVPLTALTHATFLSKGFDWRVSQTTAEQFHFEDASGISDIEPVAGPVAFQLVGDSHATQYSAGLSALMKHLGIRVEVLSSAGCPILDGVSLRSRRRAACLSGRDALLDRLRATQLPVIFVQRWEYYDDSTIDYDLDTSNFANGKEKSYHKLEHAIERTIGSIATEGRRVLLIGAQVDASCSINRARLLPGPLAHAPLPPCPPSTKTSVERWGAEMNAMLSRVRANWPDQVELLRPVDYFCDTECPVVARGHWLYWDRTHFSVAGSLYMVDHAAATFTRFLQPAAQ